MLARVLRLLACAALALGAPTGGGARCAVPTDVDAFVRMLDATAGLCAGATTCLRGELKAKLTLGAREDGGCLTAGDLGAYMGARTEYCLNKACPHLECDREKARRFARGLA